MIGFILGSLMGFVVAWVWQMRRYEPRLKSTTDALMRSSELMKGQAEIIEKVLTIDLNEPAPKTKFYAA